MSQSHEKEVKFILLLCATFWLAVPMNLLVVIIAFLSFTVLDVDAGIRIISNLKDEILSAENVLVVDCSDSVESRVTSYFDFDRSSIGVAQTTRKLLD